MSTRPLPWISFLLAISATAPAVANPKICPKTFKQAKAKPSLCGAKFSGQCTYPDGQCTCEIVERCSGVPPPYDYKPPPPTYRWHCEPKVRGDGCPGESPQTGDACKLPGKECWYGSCCIVKTVCKGGHWQWLGEECPP